MDDLCISCYHPVLETQAAVQCDVCNKWNHVICRAVKPAHNLRRKKITMKSYKAVDITSFNKIYFVCNFNK